MMAQNNIPPSVPDGKVSVLVSIIDTGCRIDKLPLEFLMSPAIQSLHYMPEIPSWSFLIEHPSGHRAVFDLGMPKQIKDLAPAVSTDDRFDDWDIRTPKEVIEVLEENQILGGQIDSVIWSHWHWDHIGNPSQYPSTTDLVVGPGFRDAFLPAYPTNQTSPVRESDFRGRKLVEIDFQTSCKATKVLDFPAFDFFGDGSFYLLDPPGHAIGHIGGLARTTVNPDTFIFMAGDLIHHGGQLRPSPYLQIPSLSKDLSNGVENLNLGASFDSLLLARNGSRKSPFFKSTSNQVVDEEGLSSTRRKAQQADAHDNIWLICAHDPTILEVADFFPASANNWKEKGWRDKTLWSFLGDLRNAVGCSREEFNAWSSATCLTRRLYLSSQVS